MCGSVKELHLTFIFDSSGDFTSQRLLSLYLPGTEKINLIYLKFSLLVLLAINLNNILTPFFWCKFNNINILQSLGSVAKPITEMSGFP